MDGTEGEEAWQRFDREGFLDLGRVLDDAALAAACKRSDDIMLGNVRYGDDRLLMQLDPGGAYGTTTQTYNKTHLKIISVN